MRVVFYLILIFGFIEYSFAQEVVVKQVKNGVDVLNKGVAAVVRFLTPVTNFFKGIIGAAKKSTAFRYWLKLIA